ncbi:hypothetical protein [Vibrio japonicus]|uniref:Uncharacterized protein n=1 Tax=Vibrio japonicus TaxID=1824638 RepID=A0ABY5LKN4_9VIBR|nr:hypothetical protein [Vibrio japonicus]UUM31476.1 hypothetical protein NP165_04920 [Vibrio japonicus]
MGFFSDLITMGPGFALDGLKLDIDNTVHDIKENPRKAVVKVATSAFSVAIASNVITLLGKNTNSIDIAKAFENSPECDDWIEETGGSDESFSEYFDRWERRNRST